MASTQFHMIVQQLYLAYLGRPADPLALIRFSAALEEAGMRPDLPSVIAAYRTHAQVKTLIDAFATSNESKDLYGDQGSAQFVNAIYRSLFNRDADPDGLAFWSGAIDGGMLGRGQAAVAILEGALTNATEQGRADAALIARKSAVAAMFTAELDTAVEVIGYVGNNAAGIGRALLRPVTADTDLDAYRPLVLQAIAGLTMSGPLAQLDAPQARVGEGQVASFLVTASVPDGTEIMYALSGVTSSDIVGGMLTGRVTIRDGKGEIVLHIAADTTTEGTETLWLNVGSHEVAIVVDDTSVAPAIGLVGQSPAMEHAFLAG